MKAHFNPDWLLNLVHRLSARAYALFSKLVAACQSERHTQAPGQIQFHCEGHSDLNAILNEFDDTAWAELADSSDRLIVIDNINHRVIVPMVAHAANLSAKRAAAGRRGAAARGLNVGEPAGFSSAPMDLPKQEPEHLLKQTLKQVPAKAQPQPIYDLHHHDGNDASPNNATAMPEQRGPGEVKSDSHSQSQGEPVLRFNGNTGHQLEFGFETITTAEQAREWMAGIGHHDPSRWIGQVPIELIDEVYQQWRSAKRIRNHGAFVDGQLRKEAALWLAERDAACDAARRAETSHTRSHAVETINALPADELDRYLQQYNQGLSPRRQITRDVLADRVLQIEAAVKLVVWIERDSDERQVA